MSKRIPLSVMLRQGDLLGEIAFQQQLEQDAAARAAHLPRLLIAQCGSKKDLREEAMPAQDRYTGPLWQSVRKHAPGRAFICALSAKFGLIDGRREIPAYNLELNDSSADAMAQGGAGASWPKAPACRAKTQAGTSRHQARVGEMDRTNAIATVAAIVSEAGQPLRDVAVVGGHRYVRVAVAMLEDLRRLGFLAADCRIVVVNDEIGRMRQRMNAWLAEG